MIALLASVCLIAVAGLQGSVGQSIAAQKCKEYGKLLQNSCNNRTFDGDKAAKLGEFPFMAALKYNATGEDAYKCTGALISKNYVVAPAYCLYVRDFGPVISVVLGQLYINEATLAPSAQEINVQELIRHPRYHIRNKTNVIGLIKLEKDVVFNKNVHPICLNEIDIKDDTFMSSGWSYYSETNDRDRYVGHLIKTKMTAYTPDECKQVYAGKRGMVTNDIICAGTKKNECYATPVGTLQVDNKNVSCMDSLIAIVNFGLSMCGGPNLPDAYTKIDPYVPWIESVIWS